MSRRARRAIAALATLIVLGIAGAAAVANAERFPDPLRGPLTDLKDALRPLVRDDIKLSFAKSVLAGTSSTNPTVLQFGPDGRLYVAQQNGLIKAYTVERRGEGDYAVTATETIDALRRIPNHDDDGSVNPGVKARQLTGMLVLGTRVRPELYVTSSDPRIGGGTQGDLGVDTNSGIVSRLTREGETWRLHHLVRGLPRSKENHSPNGLALDPIGRILYVAVGSNNNLGAPSRFFVRLPQYALSGAVLQIDLAAIGETTYDLPTLDDPDRPGSRDENDPFGGNNGLNQARLLREGPVSLYASGFRNPYDVVVTQTGAMYTIDNGPNPDQGGIPEGEGPDGRCTNAPNDDDTIRGNLDALHVIPARGYYGGTPNPTRGNLANRFAGQSPVRLADPRECEYLPPSRRPALPTFPQSTNGLVEYTAGNLGGVLRGDLLATSFDNTIYRIDLDATGRQVLGHETLFSAVDTSPSIPLGLTAQGDADPFPGTVWVGELVRGGILVYEPDDYEEQAELAGAWRRLAPASVARQEVASARVGDTLYLAGGGRVEHEAYDLRTNKWSRVARFPLRADHVQAVALGESVYYVGGLLAWPEPATGAAHQYDPKSDRFTELAAMPRPRGAGAAVAHDGRIYYFGGLAAGRAVPWVDVYDPAADRWTRLPDMPRARDHLAAAAIGDTIYVTGGRATGLDETEQATDAFDLDSGSWRTGLAELPTARGGGAVAVVGGRMLVFGGETGDGAVEEVEAYDPAQDVWKRLKPMPTPRHGIQAAVCDGVVYLAAGGEQPGGEAPSRVVEAYSDGSSPPCGGSR